MPVVRLAQAASFRRAVEARRTWLLSSTNAPLVLVSLQAAFEEEQDQALLVDQVLVVCRGSTFCHRELYPLGRLGRSQWHWHHLAFRVSRTLRVWGGAWQGQFWHSQCRL